MQPISGALLEALRAWRLGVAREHGVPAYVVFHDATLESIAALRPREPLRGVSGAGASAASCPPECGMPATKGSRWERFSQMR